VRVRFWNPDGSAAFCGNGSRCAARYARLRGMASDRMILETVAGEVPAEVLADGVRLTLPPPKDHGDDAFVLDGRTVTGRRIDAGAPHWVALVDDVRDSPLARWGPVVRRDPRFGPAGVNVDVARFAADSAVVELRTWERGVEGETLACGSGAVAAAFAVRRLGGPERLRIMPASGYPLWVRLDGPPEAPERVVLEGDARIVFDGEIHPEAGL
jgi:diaminopimelate epimerase